jgi:hypothetical protein
VPSDVWARVLAAFDHAEGQQTLRVLTCAPIAQ